MNRTLAGAFWIALYLIVVFTPMLLMTASPAPSGRSFWVEFSLGLGFVGLTQIAIQFALIARFRHITAPYGIDIILKYHRQIAIVAIALVVAHVVILVIENPARASLLNPVGGTWASRTGNYAVYALILLTLLSVFRKRLKLDYEIWRVTHTLLGVAAIVLAHVHVHLAGHYTNTWWKEAILIGFSTVMIAALVYLRLIKPMQQRRRSYTVVEVRPEHGQTWTLALEPVGHTGMSFSAGQFAWIKLGSTPYTLEEHPFSFSSSAETRGRLEFGIKELGDFTSQVGNVAVGTPAYVDGPHGAFSIYHTPAEGYVFIGGGVGVTPFISMLRTMADRGDTRPVLLIYGVKKLEEVAYREELASLEKRLNLQVAYVLEEPPEDWAGERGYINQEVLERLIPKEKIERQFFICGPNPMMDLAEEALVKSGFPLERIQSERFDLV